jgi:hypothetical protein
MESDILKLIVIVLKTRSLDLSTGPGTYQDSLIALSNL